MGSGKAEARRIRAHVLKSSAVLPACFALYSAVPGTTTVLFGKMCAELLRVSLSGDNQVTLNPKP